MTQYCTDLRIHQLFGNNFDNNRACIELDMYMLGTCSKMATPLLMSLAKLQHYQANIRTSHTRGIICHPTHADSEPCFHLLCISIMSVYLISQELKFELNVRSVAFKQPPVFRKFSGMIILSFFKLVATAGTHEIRALQPSSQLLVVWLISIVRVHCGLRLCSCTRSPTRSVVLPLDPIQF